MKNLYSFLLVFLCVFQIAVVSGQNNRISIENYLSAHKESLNISQEDLDLWRISSDYVTQKNELNHVHIQQQYNGVDVFNAMCNFTIDKEGKVLHAAGNLIKHIAQKVNATTYVISPESANRTAIQKVEMNTAAISKTEVENVYFPYGDNELRMSYIIVIYSKNKQNVWNVVVDGTNGNVLAQWDQVLHCSFGDGFNVNNHDHTKHEHHAAIPSNNTRVNAGYNVFAFPVESPIHGTQSLVTDPHNTTASPFGWHDVNLTEGPEFTITRGNNVFAYEDADDNDNPGYSPDGGPNLLFDFPYTPNASPLANQDAALTNLFYTSNMVHDIMYLYGFDEQAGNFQSNNFGNGGLGGDQVFAEGLDGSGFNNANFFTPRDGFNPTMQMYLWNGASENLYINSPEGLARGYVTTGAAFGPDIPANPITADVALYEDATPPINDACEPATNSTVLNNKIVILDRGDCVFVDKVKRAQTAGARAVIVVNNVEGAPINMGGTDFSITIPSLMVSKEDGDAIKAEILNGGTVNATIVDSSANAPIYDGDFDNGIIVHEYGHGISTRIIGGPNNSNCMNNDEQMGEGWSDYFGLVLTLNMNATNPIYRPIGTYVLNETPEAGFGIRPAPYDTSFNVNDFTYADIKDVSVPHGVGFVWATILWDMTWALIEEHGYDPDIFNGTGGNNIALQLVIDGLKMTPCNPSFVSGRDAILAADQINNNGANTCLIWEVFARRGVGVNASTGALFVVGDEIESFEVPECAEPFFANFESSVRVSCDGIIEFTDQSIGEPLSYHWDFGDGDTAITANPTHTYESSGTYTVTLTIANENSSSTETKTNLITVILLDPPTVDLDLQGCAGDTFALTADSDNALVWFNSNDEQVGTGNPFITPALNSSTTFSVAQVKTVSEVQCVSDRSTVEIDIADANFTYQLNGSGIELTDLSTNATSWAWDFGDDITSDQQNPTHIYLLPGIYVLELSINNGQCSQIQIVDLSTVGILEDFKALGIDLIPNPAKNSTILKSGMAIPKNAIIQVISTDGKIVKEMVLTSSQKQVEINIKDLPNGIYSVIALYENRSIIQEKLVVLRR
ncbi:MAG: T9SS-dependent M36 family metallopeptidase [Chitinophagales bacterium]